MADVEALSPSHAQRRTKGSRAGELHGHLPHGAKSSETKVIGSPRRNIKTKTVNSSAGSQLKSPESRQSTVVSQTLSSSGKGKDGLLHRVKSEVPRLPTSDSLFAPDKVRVKTEKMPSRGSPAKVKTETLVTSQTLKSPDSNQFKVIGKDSLPEKKPVFLSATLSPEKKPVVLSATVSLEKGKNKRKMLTGEKPRKKEDQAKKRRLESEDSDGDSDDDIPLTSLKREQKSARKEPVPKRPKKEDSSDDDKPLKASKMVKHEAGKSVAVKDKKQSSKTTSNSKAPESRKRSKSVENDDEFKTKSTPPVKKVKKEADVKQKSSPKKLSPSKKDSSSKQPDKKKAKQEPAEVWKWWEEAPLPDGVRWLTLEHKGPYFAPLYEPLPSHVHFKYDGKIKKLSRDSEEIAGFFAKMLDHEYTSKEVFRANFWEDWRKSMTSQERKEITSLEKCDFSLIHEYYKQRSEEKKQMSKEEKQKIKEENERLQQEYGICTIDGHNEKIGNWKIEPPGLFRGRGDHPKMGRLKRRTQPEEVTINIGKKAPVPDPPAGHQWKLVQHDNKVTWLASWCDSVTGNIKYVLLNASSRLKGEKDWQKYETARNLKKHVERIRQQYRQDWKSKMMHARQRAVALYFIDKLALRAGHEKDTDEEADTVGCCSLRVEHITLHDTLDGQEHVVEFDFLGKDSVRYYNCVPVVPQVYKNLKHFVKHKEPGDDLFDRLSTSELNKHLQELMPGLTAKVFRTFNASVTLQNQLEELTRAGDSIPELLLSYNRANRQVAILCNHQRTVPKTFEKSMANLKEKIDDKLEKLAEAKKEVKVIKKELKESKSSKVETTLEKKKAAVKRLEDQLRKLEVAQTDKEENKTIALGTSKLNYLDPRISVAWCKKNAVPVEKVYNKTQRDKFNWAIDMADETFVF